MQRARLFAGGVAGVIVLTAVALWLFRAPIVEFAAARAMAGAGLDKPSVIFDSLGASHLSLKDLRAGAEEGAPDLAIAQARIDFSLAGILFKGRARAVTISRGSARAIVEEDGQFSIAGWRLDPEAQPAPPPFDRLTIEDLELVAATPKGPATARFAGVFTLANGGAFDLDFAADRAGFAPASITGAKGAMTIALKDDGLIDIAGGITGDIETASGVARGVDADLFASLTSWRGFFGGAPRGLFGRAGVRLKSSTLDALETPSLSALPAAGAGPLKTLVVKGSIAGDFSADGVIVRLDDGPLTVAADRGDALTLSGGADGILYETRGKSGRAGAAIRLTGPVASGKAEIAATTDDGEKWSLDAKAALTEQTIAGVSLGGLTAAFAGAASDDAFSGRLVFDGLVRAADVGRLRLSDLPAAGTLDISADLAAGTLEISPPADECFRLDRGAFRIADQDLDARVRGATFCGAGGPAFSLNWGAKDGGGDRVRLQGALAADFASVELGQTDFKGAPPAIRFALDYEPAANSSRATGAFTGGAGVLADSLKLSNASGTFEAALRGETMTAAANLSTLTIAQAAALELVAPVVVNGQTRLENDKAAFDFDVKTPRGVLLGRGEGAHDMKSGRGSATFDSGDLAFVAGNLQPDRLIPALKGVISGATGSAGGKAAFAWTPAGVTSSGAALASNLSFQGPGVAVTRTEGVDGTLVFKSLMPVATEGDQTLRIRKIDLDALDLENGFMTFQLPGDETLKIVEAEFPWFGGTIGAYNSTMALSGAKSETELQIDNVNLSDLLAFFKVDGLSGEGTIEGVLPLTFEGGRARVDNGILSAKGAGVIRYTGQIAAAAGEASQTSELAFDALREFRYESLSTTIDGPLDGTLRFKVFFEGRSDVSLTTSRGKQTVQSPFIFRVNIDAPLLSLLDQAAVSLDVRRQIENAGREEKEPKE
ncbi:MAG: YdbH domain-containing protein [Parvularculaceae bacterium]|nr:YdbH domain-containing protein [Parvularculaceae bacterium]